MRPRVQVVLIGTVWSLLSVFFFLKWQAPVRGWIFGILGLGFLVSGLFVPPAADFIQRALKALTFAVLVLLSWILLGTTYFLVIMPLGWILRRTGSLRTHRRPGSGPATYWTDRADEPVTIERYLRPF